MSVSFRMLFKSLQVSALALLLAFAGTTIALAQSATSGAISGTVTDSAGALLPNAQVTVSSSETNASRQVKANSSGEFRVTDLAPGTYTATIIVDGFQTSVTQNIIVSVGGTATIKPKLAVGAVTDKIEVTDEAPALHLNDSGITSTVDQATIDNLPINGRRYSDFALLTPGVVSASDGFGLLSFRGISYLLNNTTIDGADDNQAYFSEARGRTRTAYTGTQGAVQEFQVNTSNYSAEYGRAAGGVINTVTKSGTNQLHGEAFFYDRDNSLGGASNPYTQIYNFDQDTGIHPQNIKPKDTRKQFGFAIGGAIFKDKLFWFYGFDRSQRNFPGVARTTDPYDLFATAANQLSGSEACVASSTSGTYGSHYSYGAPVITYTNGSNVIGPVSITANLSNPPTGGAGASYPIGQTYQGNFGACALAGALQAAQTSGPLNYQAAAASYNQGLGILATFFGTVPRFQDQQINFPKIDWQINDRNRLTVQYNRLRSDAPNGVQTQTSNFYGRGSYGSDYVKADVGVFRLSTVITNTLVN
ncbi:MAG: carboxypeptidase-like regulatory domain-containing protein, partial [Bryocella sp.]